MKRLLVITVLAVAAAPSVLGQGVTLTKVPDDQTGLKAIVEKWKADELLRQGGAFKEHGWWPWGVVALDYDNDGDVDLLAVQHGEPKTIVLRNELKEKGKLSFVNANAELDLHPSSALNGCFNPLVWDFDGDGWLDLAYCSTGNTCYLNKGGKGFEEIPFGFGQFEGIREVGDVNGDGLPDVYHDFSHLFYDAAGKKFQRKDYQHPLHTKPPETVKALLEANKEKIKAPYLRFHLRFHEGLELNGDGNADLGVRFFGFYGGPMFGRYFTTDASGKLGDITESAGLPNDAAPFFFGDLNGDRIDDVLTVGAGVYLSEGPGKFAPKAGPLTDFLKQRDAWIHVAHAVDFDGDGDLDLAVNNGRGGSARVYENNGKGEFQELHRVGTWVHSIVLCDLNNDGLPDVVIAGPGENITVLQNQTKLSGSVCQLFVRAEKPNPYAAGAVVSVFRQGDLGKAGVRPILRARVEGDGLPVSVGLGTHNRFDLKLEFSGKTAELKNIEAKPRLKVTPDGKIEEVK